jgi:hypothetical protein
MDVSKVGLATQIPEPFIRWCSMGSRPAISSVHAPVRNFQPPIGCDNQGTSGNYNKP